MEASKSPLATPRLSATARTRAPTPMKKRPGTPAALEPLDVYNNAFISADSLSTSTPSPSGRASHVRRGNLEPLPPSTPRAATPQVRGSTRRVPHSGPLPTLATKELRERLRNRVQGEGSLRPESHPPKSRASRANPKDDIVSQDVHTTARPSSQTPKTAVSRLDPLDPVYAAGVEQRLRGKDRGDTPAKRKSKSASSPNSARGRAGPLVAAQTRQATPSAGAEEKPDLKAMRKHLDYLIWREMMLRDGRSIGPLKVEEPVKEEESAGHPHLTKEMKDFAQQETELASVLKKNYVEHNNEGLSEKQLAWGALMSDFIPSTFNGVFFKSYERVKERSEKREAEAAAKAKRAPKLDNFVDVCNAAVRANRMQKLRGNPEGSSSHQAWASSSSAGEGGKGKGLSRFQDLVRKAMADPQRAMYGSGKARSR